MHSSKALLGSYMFRDVWKCLVPTGHMPRSHCIEWRHPDLRKPLRRARSPWTALQPRPQPQPWPPSAGAVGYGTSEMRTGSGRLLNTSKPTGVRCKAMHSTLPLPVPFAESLFGTERDCLEVSGPVVAEQIIVRCVAYAMYHCCLRAKG